MIDYHENTIFMIGGMVEKGTWAKTNKSAINFVTPGDVWDRIYKYQEGVWTELPTRLPKPRYGFQAVLSGDSIFIFAGDAGDGNPGTTQIDIFNVKNYKL